MVAKKKITRSTRKSALRPAGAVKRKKAHEAKPKRSPVDQPENYGHLIRLHRSAADGYRIVAGCRDFTPKEAAAHWTMRARSSTGSLIKQDDGCGIRCNICRVEAVNARDRAKNMLALLPKLKQRARRYGWL